MPSPLRDIGYGRLCGFVQRPECLVPPLPSVHLDPVPHAPGPVVGLMEQIAGLFVDILMAVSVEVIKDALIDPIPVHRAVAASTLDLDGLARLGDAASDASIQGSVPERVVHVGLTDVVSMRGVNVIQVESPHLAG